MFNAILTTPISLFLSLATLTGVTLHDTKVDRMTTAIVGVPLIVAANTDGSLKSIAGDPHTHVEHVSLKNMNSAQPRLMPRNDHKKHLLQKNAPKGAHGFDGYRLPLA